MTSLAPLKARALRGPRRGGAFGRPRSRLLPLLFTALLGVAALSACSDPEEDTSPPSNQCVPACGLGFECLAGFCRPVGGGEDAGLDSGDEDAAANNAVNNTPNNNPINNGVNNPDDVGTDPVDGEDADAAVEEESSMGDADADLPPRCTSDASCEGGLVCDLDSGECVEPPPECAVDADCSGLLVCDAAAGECVPPPEGVCASNADCSEGLDCLNGRCVEREVECVPGEQECPAGFLCTLNQCEPFGCTADAECADGRRCDVASGYCQDCLVDSDCPGDQTCQPDFKQCQEPMAGCTTNDDCLVGRVCSGGACEDAACTPDAGESANDDLGGAVVLGAAPVTQTACGFDTDWFSFDLNAGDGFILRTEYSASLSGLEVKLVDASGQEYLRANGDGLAGSMVLRMEEVPTTQTYYAVFQNFSGNRSYTMLYTPFPGGFCANDGAEPDNERAQGTAVIPEAPYTQRLCGPDSDWFSIQIPAGQSIRALLATEAGNPPGIEFYANDSTRPALRDASDQQTRVLSQRVQADTTYHVRIFTVESTHESRYTLTLSAQP